VALGVNGGGAAGTGGGDGLAVDVVGAISGNEDAGDVGGGAANGDDVAVFILVDHAPEELGVGTWPMATETPAQDRRFRRRF